MRVMTTGSGTPPGGAEEQPPRAEEASPRREGPAGDRPDSAGGPFRDRGGLATDSTGRSCARPGCPGTARATLRFGYGTRQVVLGPLAVAATPHSYDLCTAHAERTSPPRGWSLADRRGRDASAPDAGGPSPPSGPDQPADRAPAEAAAHGAPAERDFPRPETVAVLAAALNGGSGPTPDDDPGAVRLPELSPARPPGPVLAQRGPVVAPDPVGVTADAPADGPGSGEARARDW